MLSSTGTSVWSCRSVLSVSGSRKVSAPPTKGRVPYMTIGIAGWYTFNKPIRGARIPATRAHMEFSPTPFCLYDWVKRTRDYLESIIEDSECSCRTYSTSQPLGRAQQCTHTQWWKRQRGRTFQPLRPQSQSQDTLGKKRQMELTPFNYKNLMTWWIFLPILLILYTHSYISVWSVHNVLRFRLGVDFMVTFCLQIIRFCTSQIVQKRPTDFLCHINEHLSRFYHLNVFPRQFLSIARFGEFVANFHLTFSLQSIQFIQNILIHTVIQN